MRSPARTKPFTDISPIPEKAKARVRAQFNTPGQFVWHCHIVEHEDNEMMRPVPA